MSSYLGNLTIRSRLILISLLPTLAFLAFAGLDLWHEYTEKRELAHVTELAAVASKVSDTIHYMQEERGRSAGYLASKGKNFAGDLPPSRASTDAKIALLKSSIENLDYDYYKPEFRNKMQTSLSGLDNLSTVRVKVDNQDIKVPSMARYYTSTIAGLMSVVQAIEHENHNDDMTKRLSAYLSFLHAKERAGLERAMGAAGFGAGKFNEHTYGGLVRHIEAQKVYFSAFREFANPDDVALLDTVLSSGSFAKVKKFRDIAMASRDSNTVDGVTAIEWFDAMTTKIGLYKQIEDGLARRFQILAADKYKAVFNRYYFMLALVIFAQIVIAVLTYGVFRSILDPVNAVIGSTNRISEGDYETPVAGTERRGAFGKMATALDDLRQVALQNKDNEAASRREQQARVAESEKASEEVAQVVDTVASALGRLSDGDLTVHLDDNLGEQYRKLVADFNAAVERLRETVTHVVEGSDSIMSGTSEISQASDDLARRTESQAATLEETAAAVSEITGNVSKSAEGAKRAKQVAASSKSNAEAGGEVVSKAIDAMADIEQSSKEIGDIIGVIDEIAFQTNLLALNAGVEAARAGEAGRGFAVVASEVRALAQRSATAARQIKDLISTSTAQVDQGVELVKESGQALQEIVTGVSEIHEVIVDIAESAQDQASSLTQVSSAVNQLDQVTQENAAMVEQATAATRTLSTQTSELTNLVAKFKTGSGATSGARTSAASAAPYRPQPAVDKISNRVERFDPVVANGSYPSAPIAVSNGSADAGWEEF
ncbi:MAG: nitrate- and nitrite sensing domain-containing protein [Hyphomicrobiaceae bacterium]